MPTPTASGTVSSFVQSGINDLDALLNGDFIQWGIAGSQAATLTYSFPVAGAAWESGYGAEVTAANFLPLSTAQMEAARGALATWGAVANITFQEITETATSVGDLRIAFSAAVGDEAWGYAFYPGEESYAGDIWINRQTTAAATFTPGDYDYESLIHEIGHAIGLKHPGNYNAGGGGSEGPYITNSLDKTNFTIMSYTEPEWGGISPLTPGVYDILALQYLYGANTTTQTGDTTYTFLPSNPLGQSIWDAGGTDILDVSAYVTSVSIDLREGHYSSIGLIENIGIAFDATIEDAKGGSAGDVIYGNEVSNRLTGNAGGDKFIFASILDAVANLDHVTDFVSGSDKLYLGRSVFSSLTSGADLGELQLAMFNSSTGGSAVGAVTGTSYILFDSATGTVYYDEDAIGSKTAVKFAVLDGVGSIVASDLYIFESSPGDGSGEEELYDGTTELGTDDSDDLAGGDGNDYIWCGGGNDTAVGGVGDDYVDGGVGDDRLSGGSGIDYMVGGDGKDRIDGGDGADEVYGEAGNDTVVAGAGDDYVEGDDDHDSLEGGAGDDLLGGGDGADKLDGGEGEDEIYGDEGNDQLIGGAGNDSLDGGAGSDKMAGGAGDDAYFVDAKKDSITETAENGTADAVISSVDYTLGKYVEILFLYGDTGLTGKGNAADNDIVGSDNDDALYGKGGNDLIEGGGGNDCFYFDVKPDASTNVDDIVDFVSGEDALYLAKKIFSAYKTTGTVAPTDLATFDSSAGGTLTSAAGSSTRFLYDSAGGDLYYDKDGSGALVAVKFATLVGTPPLVASDLVLV